MKTITNTVTIAATPEQVWSVLSDLTATRQWLPGVVSARMYGPVRVCAMADGQEVHERISDVSDEERSYRFAHVRVPLQVRDSGGRFAVTPGTEPGTATVTLTTTFTALDETASDQVAVMVSGAF